MEECNFEVKSIKIGLFGDSETGKTSILQTFLGVELNEDTSNKRAVEKLDKKIKLETGKEIKLIFWDTIGNEGYRSVVLNAIKGAQGIALVFDVTSKKSFDNINLWLNNIKENSSDSTLVILGNKTDMEKDKWQVTQEEIDSLVKEKNLVYYATSSKNSKSLNDCFNYLANTTYIKELEKKINEINKKFLEKTGNSLFEFLNDVNSENKRLKELRNSFNYYKSEYEKLKKNYDKLEKNYDDLKYNNLILKNNTNNDKEILNNLADKSKEYIQEMVNLKNIILQKDDEINNLNLKIKNIESFNKKPVNDDDIISIHFISSDQNINCPIKCLRNDTFAEAEEKLYQKYQKYRETNNNFFSNGSPVIRFKKIIENNINDGDKVELIKLS